MASNVPDLASFQVGAAGVLWEVGVDFDEVYSSIAIKAGNFSNAGAYVYMQIGQIPAAAADATGRVWLADGETVEIPGQIEKIGFITTAGTCSISLVGAKQ
jgi:hypothetical protein